ncbi:MAG: HD domain-containing protein [Candidatus Izimaplasma sp.]|nr:HD domain-containing protein [Candidatus Izimaplasma bacterium]
MNETRIKEFVKKTIKDSDRSDYVFRDRYDHSLRVKMWAERLHKIEGGDFDVIRAAALLHDIGWHKKKNHADISERLSKPFLKTLNLSSDQKDKVLEAIKYHNRRKHKNLNLETTIIQDADLLDELGALTIVWDSMATMTTKNPSYKKAYKRIKKYSGNIPKKIDELHLDSAKKIYKSRVSIIDSFIKELRYELGINEND